MATGASRSVSPKGLRGATGQGFERFGSALLASVRAWDGTRSLARAPRRRCGFAFVGGGKPELGRWKSRSGLDVADVLGTVGPESVDVDFWFERNRENRGRKLVDFLWPTNVYGFKLLSRRFADLLVEFEPRIQTWPVDVRAPEQVPGYVLALEPVGVPSPVHSYFSGRRVNDIVVSTEVLEAVKRVGIEGLRITNENDPFPGDHL